MVAQRGGLFNIGQSSPLKKDIIGVAFHLTDTISGYPGPIEATITYQLEDNHLRMISTGQVNRKHFLILRTTPTLIYLAMES